MKIVDAIEVIEKVDGWKVIVKNLHECPECKRHIRTLEDIVVIMHDWVRKR
jgi:hypothetical protein